MRCWPAFAAALLFPGTLLCAQSGDSGLNFAAGFLQMLASLAVVIGLIFIVYYLSGRLLGRSGAGGAPRHIRVVESKFLGPKRSLMLVEVGGEYLLLSSGEEGVRLVKQIEMVEEIEVLEELKQGAESESFQGRLNGFLTRMPVLGKGGSK